MRPDPLQPGHLALVTGGASGIGLGITRALLKAGLHVIIADVREDHLAHARHTLGAQGKAATFLPLDVTKAEQWKAARAYVEATFGKLHVLCLNAGVGILGPMLEASERDWAWITAVNVDGVLLGVETFLPHMQSHGEAGHILATSSMGGLIVANDGGIYSAAKFGVVALMEGLRAVLAGSRLSASVLCPAAVNTNIFDHERMRPADFTGEGEGPPEADIAAREAFARKLLSHGRSPDEVGAMACEAIRVDAPYLFTDRNVLPTLTMRRDALLAFS